MIADGKAVEGGRTFNLNDKAILRCHVKLTKDQVAGLGVLRIGPARQERACLRQRRRRSADFAGWQAVGHAKFERDVSEFLKAGDNVIAIYCSNYRRRGQLPLSRVARSRRKTRQDYRRSLDLRDAISTVRVQEGRRDVHARSVRQRAATR